MYVRCAFFLYGPIKNGRKMTALFLCLYGLTNGRLLMLSDGENLTNLDCELEQNHAKSKLDFSTGFTAF